MKRALAVPAIAIAWMMACQGDPAGDPFGTEATPLDAADSAVITHGPIVGAVTTNSAKVFGRTSAPATVHLEYWPADEPALVERSADVVTSAESDFTFHAPLEGLAPDTRYAYRYMVGGSAVPTPIGDDVASFRSAKPRGHGEPFSIAIVADAEGHHEADAYREIANLADEPAFLVMLGDFDHRNPATTQPFGIESWRDMHRDVLQDEAHGRDLAAHVSGRMPLFRMWDDHDFGDNNAHREMARGWADIAFQSFQEYFPLPEVPGYPNGLYYRFGYGDVDFFMLDLRSQRDDHRAPFCDPNKSMLGAQQFDWLIEGLASSDATWKVVLSSVPFNPTVLKNDAWLSYRTEWERLVASINAVTSDVIVVSGDIHTGGAIDDGTHSAFPELNVPHLNLGHVRHPPGCTALGEEGVDACGNWSEGVHLSEGREQGFARIRFDGDRATLSSFSRDASGDHRLSLQLETGSRRSRLINKTQTCAP